MPSCPQCGLTTDPTDRFCRHCGRALGAVPATAAKYETKMISIGPSFSYRRTNAKFVKAIDEMASRGWELVDNSRVGGAGGTLTFRRPMK